jgi:peptidoglycan hydrolase CwlO-like protein
LSVVQSSVSVADFQEQINALLKRLEATTQYIQETLAMNEAIRQDIAVLEKKLTYQQVA